MVEWLEKLEDKRGAAERRRNELLRALREDEVADPFSITIFSIATLKLLAISAAVSVGTALITRALTPRQRFTTGQLQGTLQVPQSDQGLPIVEGYGADPATNADAFQSSHVYALEDRVVSGGYFYVVTTAGTSAATAPTFPTTKGASVTSGGVTFTNYGRTGGGFRLPMLVVWTSGLRRHERQVESSGGGKGPEAPEHTEVTYDIDLAVMPARGPLYVKRIRANTNTIYNVYRGESAYYEAEAGGNTKAGGAATVADALASGGNAVTVPQNGSLQWNNVYGDGSAIRLEFYLKTTAPVTVEFTWTGESGTTVFNASISSTGGVYNLEYGSAPWLLVSGSSNTVKVKNLSATAIVFDKLGVRISGGATGVPDPDVDGDEDYDEALPPDPTADDREPTRRFSGELDEDNDGVRTGSIQAGGYAGIAIYPGNDSQLPDPTMQAAVDAQYGADSTPAFHDRCLIVLTNFYLTEYGGAIPLIQTLADHQTLDTLEAIFDHFCGRAGVLEPTDYDFSGLRRVFVRGFPVTPPYAPADVMEELARVFNVYFYESDKIYARVRGSQSTVAALTSANLGWVDGDADDEGEELQSLDFSLATQTEIAGRYELTFVDPGRDFDQNTQGTGRSTRASKKTEKIELAITMFPEEAREVEQRELYEEAVESSKVSLSLDWSYIWLTPGDSFTVTEDDGTVTRVFAESVKPNVGVIPVEGLTEETAVFSQATSASGEPFETPPVPIPAASILGLWDGPLLSDVELGVNEGSGFYVWTTKRRGDGGWNGAALYVDRGLGYEYIETFEKQAVFGTAATVLVASTEFLTQTADALTVDLYSDSDTLESVTEDDIDLGANACIVGNEVCQILTATRDTSDLTLYPNRWDLVIARRGVRSTEYAAASHVIGERFVLLKADAVKFVPILKSQVDAAYNYKMVSNGQSLDDAATVTFAWTGNGLKPLAIARVETEPDTGLAPRDSAGTVLVHCWPRSAVGNIGNEYQIQCLSDDRLTVIFEKSFREGTLNPAFLVGLGGTKFFTGLARNTIARVATFDLQGRSLQKIHAGGGYRNRAEATLKVTGSGNNQASFGLVSAAKLTGELTNAQVDYLFTISALTGTLKAYASGVEIFSETSTSYAATGKRVWVELLDGRAYFYVDRGDASPYAVVSEVPANFPLAAWARIENSGAFGDLASVADVMMTTDPFPTTVITAEEQTLYYGGLKNPLQVSIRQHSGIREVGYGMSFDGEI